MHHGTDRRNEMLHLARILGTLFWVSRLDYFVCAASRSEFETKLRYPHLGEALPLQPEGIDLKWNEDRWPKAFTFKKPRFLKAMTASTSTDGL
jgi:hypothetical protein